MTYQSAQTHDPRRYKLAQNLGAMTAALHNKDFRKAVLGAHALRLQLKWVREKRRSQLAKIGGCEELSRQKKITEGLRRSEQRILDRMKRATGVEATRGDGSPLAKGRTKESTPPLAI